MASFVPTSSISCGNGHYRLNNSNPSRRSLLQRPSFFHSTSKRRYSTFKLQGVLDDIETASSSCLSHTSMSLSFNNEHSLWLSTTASAQTFEPQTDWAALGTFISIMLVFLALVIRTNAVERAVVEREMALKEVRACKAKALEAPTSSYSSSSMQDETTIDSTITTRIATPQQPRQNLKEALKRYEEAVLEEERLRNIVPGVIRIVPPSAGRESEERARDAARQLLGKDYDIGEDRRQVASQDGKLPAVMAGVILVSMGILLTALLVFLSLDPKMASELFDAL